MGWKKIKNSYGGTEDNRKMAEMYTQSSFPRKIQISRKNIMKSLFVETFRFGLILILLGLCSIGFGFTTLAMVIGIIGCISALFGLLPMLVVLFISFFREK